MSDQPPSLLGDRLPLEASQRFVDQFNAEIHRSYRTLEASTGFVDGGLYRSEIHVSGEAGRYRGDLTWVLKRDLDGRLVSVTVEGDGEGWRDSSQEFFRQVMANALADRHESFAHRKLFHYYGPLLAGEYWFGRIRVAPLHPDDENPRNTQIERVLVIDHEVRAPDASQAHLVGEEMTRRYGSRIAFLLDVGLTSEKRRYRWITQRRERGEVEHLRGEAGVVLNQRFEGMPKKGEICHSATFGHTTHIFGRRGPLQLPRVSRPLWRSLKSAPIRSREAFDAMCRLYQVGAVIERYYATAALAYFVAGVEAASVSLEASFGEFMRRFVPAAPDRNEMIDRLYGEIRSSHFHGGRFPLGDFLAPGMMLADVAAARRDRFYLDGRKLLRTALINWTEELVEPA